MNTSISTLQKNRETLSEEILHQKENLKEDAKTIAKILFLTLFVGGLFAYLTFRSDMASGSKIALAILLETIPLYGLKTVFCWVAKLILGWHREQRKIRQCEEKIAAIDRELNERDPVCSNSTAQCQHKPTCVPLPNSSFHD